MTHCRGKERAKATPGAETASKEAIVMACQG